MVNWTIIGSDIMVCHVLGPKPLSGKMLDSGTLGINFRETFIKIHNNYNKFLIRKWIWKCIDKMTVFLIFRHVKPGTRQSNQETKRLAIDSSRSHRVHSCKPLIESRAVITRFNFSWYYTQHYDNSGKQSESDFTIISLLWGCGRKLAAL